MANILIIDDDRAICKALVGVVSRIGYDAAYAVTLKEGLNMVSSDLYDVVFLDVRLPDGNGLDALPEIRRSSSSPEVIIITGEGDPDGAELAIKSGAWDARAPIPGRKANPKTSCGDKSGTYCR